MLENIVSGLILVLTQSQDGSLIHVTSQTPTEVVGKNFSSKFQSFSQVIDDAKAAEKIKTYLLSSMTHAFMHLDIKSLGFGLTYSDHKSEVGLKDVVVFEKKSKPTALHQDIVFKNFLDYETEVAILMHRSEPDLFGYLIHNDLTDRMVQVVNYDENNAAPGFSKAKSFVGSNANSVLLAIGYEELWYQLQIDFFVNGQKRQTVNTTKNILTPKEIHKRIFFDNPAETADWILVGTGTPGGTVFKAPTTMQMLKEFVASGFNIDRTKENWAKSFNYLAPNDHLHWSSEILGSADSRIVVR